MRQVYSKQSFWANPRKGIYMCIGLIPGPNHILDKHWSKPCTTTHFLPYVMEFTRCDFAMA
jgi:hypothetical protein